MNRLMTAKIAVASILILILSSSGAAALEIRLNGSPLPLPPEVQLRAQGYPIPVGGRVERGLSLAELLPPLSDAWRLEAKSSAAKTVWTGDDLAESLGAAWLLENAAGGWDLSFGEKRAANATRIEISGDKAVEGELEVWLSWEGVPELKREIELWSKLTGVRVRSVDVPDTRSKLLATLRGGGRLPDLVMLQSDNVPDFVSANAIQALDGMNAARSVEKGAEAFALGGRRWALPFYFDAQLLFYSRSSLFRAPAIDWTVDDLEAEARRIARGGKTPMAWNAYSAYWLLSFALGFGKPAILEADGRVLPDDPGTRAALLWLLRVRDEGLLSVLERDAMIGRFASGEVAMILSGSYSIPEFERVGLDFGVASYPVVASTGKAIAPILDFKGFAVGRTTKSPVSARRLLQHLSSLGVQQRFTTALSKLPANRDAWEIVKTTNRYYPQLARSYEIGVTLPSAVGYPVYKNIMWKMLRFVFSGSMTVDEALRESRRLVDANMLR